MQRTKIGDMCYRGTRSRKVQCVRLSGQNFETKSPVDKYAIFSFWILNRILVPHVQSSTNQLQRKLVQFLVATTVK